MKLAGQDDEGIDKDLDGSKVVGPRATHWARGDDKSGGTRKGCNVLELDEVISGIFEEVSYVDMMSELDEINQSMLQSGTGFFKVEKKYKTVAKKVKPVANTLSKGSDEVIEEASQQPMLRSLKNIGHKFTKETLKQLKIDEDGFLTDEEVKCFQEMLKKHGKVFAFEPGEIGCVDPKLEKEQH
ncbi:hypothetical protein L7F22_049718 [Adiantum nelumboides]|nr:hypothetical protein [Adiantum nelumboides]